MKKVTNPILRGFNPDPSALRVGDDYYIATSTFQWWPGVQIHHSKDLVNWHTVAYPLDRVSQLDMNGINDSGGIWAPCLKYHDGLYYLIFTNVMNFSGLFKDVHNYMVTAPDIKGPWSEPIYLNSYGFDPSIFFDDDGRAYILNMLWDYRSKAKVRGKFAGILLQEFSLSEKKLVGEPVNIFRGTDLGVTEGPNMMKKDGYYYLFCAEGGTGASHAETVARSKNILGPYEVHPQNPIITSAGRPDLKLKRCGHADVFDTPDGDWYMVHLCGRPLTGKDGAPCSVLGRETSLQKIEWGEDGWPRLAGGGNSPFEMVEVPDLPEHKWEEYPETDDFDGETLGIQYQTLRKPISKELCNTTERRGYLRLRGAESLSSHFTQALVARRQQAFKCVAETCVEFEPDSYLQSAGLVVIYDSTAYHYLRITHDEKLGKCVGLVSNKDGEYYLPLDLNETLDGAERVYLRAEIDYEKLNFSYSTDNKNWHGIGGALDMTVLSDETNSCGGFTGTFIGLCAQDLSGLKKIADFDYLTYKELEE